MSRGGNGTVHKRNGEGWKASEGDNEFMERQEGTEISFTISGSFLSTTSVAGALLDLMAPDSKRSVRIRFHTQEGTDRWNTEEKRLGAMLTTGRSFE
jgi:hypothetical protein